MRKYLPFVLMLLAAILLALPNQVSAQSKRQVRKAENAYKVDKRVKKDYTYQGGGKRWNSETQQWEFTDPEWRKRQDEYRYDPQTWRKPKYRNRVKARVKRTKQPKEGKKRKNKSQEGTEKKQ